MSDLPGISVASAAEKGPRRTMEDRHCIVANYQKSQLYIAVFDGHGGSAAAEVACNSFGIRARIGFDEHASDAAILEALCGSVAAAVRAKQADFGLVGTTAVFAVVTLPGHPSVAHGSPPRITSCNIGDSYAVVCPLDESADQPVVDLSEHHIPELLESEISRRGGVVVCGRVGCLNIARALGDFYNEYIGRDFSDPRSATLGPGCGLIVGTDGVFNIARCHHSPSGKQTPVVGYDENDNDADVASFCKLTQQAFARCCPAQASDLEVFCRETVDSSAFETRDNATVVIVYVHPVRRTV